jgi:hypothetical protein
MWRRRRRLPTTPGVEGGTPSQMLESERTTERAPVSVPERLVRQSVEEAFGSVHPLMRGYDPREYPFPSGGVRRPRVSSGGRFYASEAAASEAEGVPLDAAEEWRRGRELAPIWPVDFGRSASGDIYY